MIGFGSQVHWLRLGPIFLVAHSSCSLRRFARWSTHLVYRENVNKYVKLLDVSDVLVVVHCLALFPFTTTRCFEKRQEKKENCRRTDRPQMISVIRSKGLRISADHDEQIESKRQWREIGKTKLEKRRVNKKTIRTSTTITEKETEANAEEAEAQQRCRKNIFFSHAASLSTKK